MIVPNNGVPTADFSFDMLHEAAIQTAARPKIYGNIIRRSKWIVMRLENVFTYEV